MLFPNLSPKDDREVLSLSCDSRTIGPNALFFALGGNRQNGQDFIPQAIAAGAVAVVTERPQESAFGECLFLPTTNARAELARVASLFYAKQPAIIVAVTGTSGKTSVAYFTQQIWATQGFQAASLGTLGVIEANGSMSGSLTTPDPITLHETLNRLAVQGISHLALEASSHGLDQYRLDGVNLRSGAFTNLSQDHLDYHADFDAYLHAKLRLFQHLLHSGQPAVIDMDSQSGKRVARRCQEAGLQVFSVGYMGQDLHLVSTRPTLRGSEISLEYRGRDYSFTLPLIGAFQAANALVAAGLCITSGSDGESTIAALSQLRGAPGRLELVGESQGAAILIDYAHKPGALETILRGVRTFVPGRIVVVFGCGGDRDRGKRPLMGEIAVRDGDVVIVTDDNPRSEDPASIRQEILARAAGAIEIGDRCEAIAHGIDLLRPGDMLIVAGKGHESGQIIGNKVLNFNDAEIVRSILAARNL